jgi:hypothetical protein
MFLRTSRIKESIENYAVAKARIEEAHAIAEGMAIPDTALATKNAFPLGIVFSWTWFADQFQTWNHNLLLAPAGNFFVTSDSPCVWFADLGIAGLDNNLLEISLPLTPSCLLLISRNLSESICCETRNDCVDYYNWRTIRHCHKYWISCNKVIKPSWLQDERYWHQRF